MVMRISAVHSPEHTVYEPVTTVIVATKAMASIGAPSDRNLRRSRQILGVFLFQQVIVNFKALRSSCHTFCQHVADTFAEGNLVKQCRYEFFSRISAEG